MIYKMLEQMKQAYREEILEYMAEQYVCAGRADRFTAEYLAQDEYDYSSDDEIIEVLTELGYIQHENA